MFGKKKKDKKTKTEGTSQGKKTKTEKTQSQEQAKGKQIKAAPLKGQQKEKIKEKPIKHNDSEEMNGVVKPIVVKINKGADSAKGAPKVLRRVNKTKGGYTAWDARTGKTFATEKEAKDYALDVLKKTGLLIPVTPTDRQVTHTFKPEEEKKNK